MKTIHNPILRHRSAPAREGVRAPRYECADLPQGLRLTVFVPGVEQSGVEIMSQGPDLFVRARRPHPVRINWEALQLEKAGLQPYELKLRLGRGFDFTALQAALNDGVLTLDVPKRGTVTNSVRQVAQTVLSH